MDGEQVIPDDRGAAVAGAAPPATVSKDLSKLSLGERLWLWRRSGSSTVLRRDGTAPLVKSQLEAAVELDVDVSHYWAAEHDELPEDKIAALVLKVREPPYTLTAALKIARRRSDLNLAQVACGVNLRSRPSLYKLEEIGDERVVEFWEQEGFRFPSEFLVTHR